MDRFKVRAADAYGDGAYIYDESIFLGNNSPITIVCPDHGPFTITPDNFLYNAGCKKCRGVHPRGYPVPVRRRFPGRRGKRGPAPKRYSFYIHSMGSEFIKIGITEGDVEKRRAQIEAASIYRLECVYTKEFKSRKLCLAVERLVKAIFPMRVAPAESMSDGISETTHKNHLPQILALIDAIPGGPAPTFASEQNRD